MSRIPPQVISDASNPQLLLRQLGELGAATVLLLGPGQSLKPGAPRELAELAWEAKELHWCPAGAHPDLDLGPLGRWLQAVKRPPFGPGQAAEARAWGLLGPAEELAETLARALEDCGDGEDWQALWRAQLSAAGLPAKALEPCLLFQESLPTPEEFMEQELRRGRTLARLRRDNRPGLPADCQPGANQQAEVPEQWMSTALALDAVPKGGLAGVTVAGLPAAELLPSLARAVFGRRVALAYAEGWHSAPSRPAAVARPIRRIGVVFPAYGGSLNLAVRSADALEALGFEVQRIDPSHHAAAVAAVHHNKEGADALFKSIEQECLFAINARKPQALWILAQAPLSLGALRAFRRQGILTGYWFCEDYRVRDVWRALAPAVDAFFPIQSGPFDAALRSIGAAPMPVLPLAAAREACLAPPARDEERRLSFFGAPYANRVRLFEALADLPLELYGEGWDQAASALLKPLVRNGKRLSEAEGFELFRGSAVNLNLHSSPFHHGIDPDGDYVNPRAYEIAACAGFQLIDRRRDLAAAFEEGRELEAFSSVAELREQVLRWTADPRGRRAVADASRRRVLAEHTYEHRMNQALRAMGLVLPSPVLGAAIPH